MMKNKEIVKNIRKIWREELKDCKLWMDFSYNDKRSYGRRLKLVCSVIGMGYYENMELRDNVIKKVRNYVKDNKIIILHFIPSIKKHYHFIPTHPTIHTHSPNIIID